MIIEYVLLLVFTLILMIGSFTSSSGGGALAKAFKESGPRLGARIEKQLAVGESFADPNGRNQWNVLK